MHEFLHCLLHAFLDTIKMLPLLFLAYLLMELLEHKTSSKMEKALEKIGHAGPLAGSLLGCVPQCGFSATSANLYSSGLITEGTLIAVFLATSDEAVVLLLSSLDSVSSVWKLIVTKIIIGVIIGFSIDFIYKLLKIKKQPVDMCKDCGCDEEETIWLPALKHTLKVSLFIFIVSLVLGYSIEILGEERISSLLLSGSFFQPFITALFGLIPSCAVSAAITELYTAGALSFGSAVAGLCSGAGVGLAVLLKTNPVKRENLRIIGILYFVAVASGILLNLLNI